MKKIISISMACILLVTSFLTGCVMNKNNVTDNNEFNVGNTAQTNTVGVSGLSMARIFSDGMVLQRNEPIHIFGFANSGETVTVTLAGNTATAVAADGEWEVYLPALPATKNLTLEVACGDDSLAFNSVDIGEVLVVSGQSNAQYMMYQLEDWDEISKVVDTVKNVRVYAETSTWNMHPSDYGYGTWIAGNSANLLLKGPVNGNVSAVGYIAAMKIATELGADVTVALINVCRSATPIAAWIPSDELYNDPTTYASEILKYEDYLAFWNANGRWPQNTNESQYWQTSNPYGYIPTLCYNSMIAPIKGYTASAVIWYQGESDVSNSGVYDEKFEDLQRVYSRAFANDDIPFFVVQIAPYNSDVGGLASFEAVQYDLTLNNPNVYVVSTGVDGSPIHEMDMLYGAPPTVIHPSRKSPLGYRVADRILVEIYGRDDITTAPELVSVARGSGTVTLTFDSKLYLFRGIVPEDFEVYDSATAQWHKVSGTLSGKTVVLDTSALANPTEVRYGFGGRYIELYNGELLRLNVGGRLEEAIDADGTRYAIYTDTDGGQHRVFTFYSEDGQIVRTIKSGNLTNSSGAPVPTFRVSIPA